MKSKSALKNIIRKIILSENQEVSPLDDNFWSWFGDSKVIGSDGKPLVVYHGTSEDFHTFDIKKIGHGSGNYGHYGYGIYFSDDIGEAKTYGSNIIECYLKISKPFTGSDEELRLLKKNGISNIADEIILSLDFDSLSKEIAKIDTAAYSWMVNMKKYGISKGWEKFYESGLKPKLDLNDVYDVVRFSTLNKDVHGVPDNISELMSDIGINPNNVKTNKGFEYNQALHWITDLGNRSKEFTDVIKKLGYDGVIYGSEYVVFNPNQIKSIYNKGQWSSSDNIYERKN